MKRLSLKARLISAAALFILAALGLSGLGFIYLFEKSLLWRFESELDGNIERVIAVLQLDNNGQVDLSRPVLDPRFELPYSGYYWQVSDKDQPLLRSKSLWDVALDPSPRPAKGGEHSQKIGSGPDTQKVLMRTAAILLTGTDGKDRNLFVTAAVDYEEFGEYTSQFSFDLWRGFLMLAGFLVLASWAQVEVGLRPFRDLSARLSHVRTGKIQRLDGEYPSEIEPLVNETNTLLEVHEDTVTKARERAGKLAHGLKTPLAILAAESRRLTSMGHAEAAEQINAQIKTMQHVVERELARARARAGGKHRATDSNIVVLTRRMVNAMQRLSEADNMQWSLDAPPLLRGSIDEMDFNEILGNLLDNARKWARSKVAVGLRPCANGFELCVDDDGPGASEEALRDIFAVDGFRSDPQTPGNGFGLSIARELVELYGGRISAGESRLGGFCVKVTLLAA